MASCLSRLVCPARRDAYGDYSGDCTQPNPTPVCRFSCPKPKLPPQVDYSQVDAERNPLASVARLLGIGSAFGVPLSLGTDECGVLMLYSMSCLAPRSAMVPVSLVAVCCFCFCFFFVVSPLCSRIYARLCTIP